MHITWQPIPHTDGTEQGEEVFFPRITESLTVGQDELFEEAAKGSVLSRAEMLPAVYELAHAIADQLRRGNAVSIDELGTFRLALGTEGQVTDPDQKSMKQIRVKGVHFTPSREFMDSLGNPDFTLVPGTNRIEHDSIPTTLSSWFESHDTITRREFCELLHLKRTSATNVINKLIEDGVMEKMGRNKETKYRLIQA